MQGLWYSTGNTMHQSDSVPVFDLHTVVGKFEETWGILHNMMNGYVHL